MKKISLFLGMIFLSSSLFASNLSSTNPADLMAFIESHSPLLYLSAFFCLGVLLAFTPCVLPMVPILSSIITGQGASSSKQAFKLSLSYVLGMAVTYAVAGMLAAKLGSTIQTMMQMPLIIGSFSFLCVLMALWLLGLFEFRLPGFLVPHPKKTEKNSVISAGVMGILSTLLVSPCVTAPLIGILTFISQTNNVALGGLLLFVLSLGMGLPLLLVGAGFGHVLPSTGPWMVRVKQVFALMMLAMAVWLLSRVVPLFVIDLLWISVLLVGACIFRGVDKISRVLQSVTLMGAAVLIYQVFLPAQPSETMAFAPFKTVRSIEEMDAQLKDAKAKNQRVFVEFFAGWCGDCKDMDKYVFNQASVIEAMQGALNLRVDISEKSEEIAFIRQKFHIYGIPTMLFYNEKGEVRDDLTTVGQTSKEKTLQLLLQFRQ